MVFGLSSCTIKLSTTSVPAGTPEPVHTNTAGGYVPDAPVSTELTLEEKMEQKSTIELIRADVKNDSYIAPAQDRETHQWGYIDLNGKWVIQPHYKTASEFFGDIACVSDIYGDYVFIDRSGNTVIEGVDKNFITATAVFSEGIANVKVDVDFVQNMTYIDTTGYAFLNLGKLPLAKGVSYKTSKFVEIATPFRNGLAIVMRTKNATLAAQGVDRLESAYVIDAEGSLVSALPQGLDIDEYGFDENMRVIVKAENGLLGLADMYGNVVVSPEYLRILYRESGLYLACSQSGFWGFLDKDGKVVIDFKYNNALPFSEGLAAVSNGTAWGFINETGKQVIPFIYDKVQPLNHSHQMSAENSGAFCSGIAVVQAGRFWGVIDKNGEIHFAAEADDCPILSVSNGYISFEYNGGCGVFTTDGKLVLVPEFETIGEFR